MADDITFYDQIEAYCGSLSYRQGSQLTLHVSCQTDSFRVKIERWGATRDEVWTRETIDGTYTEAPVDADSRGCRWPTSLKIDIPESWRSGFYLITLTAHDAEPGRDTAHAGFVVRPLRANQAATLLVLATNTWNAYNPWGGSSLYTGGNQVSFRRPMARGMLCRDEVDRDDRKARPTRWGEEPDVNGDAFQTYRFANGYPAAIGSSGWYQYERRFVEWAEDEGIKFDYATSTDLEIDPATTDGYDLLIGVGHDEYWSAGQRDAVEAHVRGGGNYASFSGNTMFWQVRIEPGPGGSHDTMVGHKYTAHETDPVVAHGRSAAMTGMWADPLVGRPEAAFLGGGSAWGLYNRFGQATPRGSGAFTVYRDDHWIFADTGLRYGDLLGQKHGVVAYETLGCRIQFDEYQLPVRAGGDATPADLEIVAFTPSSNLGLGESPASISATVAQTDLEFIAERIHGSLDESSMAKAKHGNAVMVTSHPFGKGGGQVVAVGTTDWVFGLKDDEPVAQVTRNILGGLWLRRRSQESSR